MLRMLLTGAVAVYLDAMEISRTGDQSKYLSTLIIKLFAHIYVSYSWPNGWTEWGDIFCGNSWVAQAKKIKILFSTGNAGPFTQLAIIVQLLMGIGLRSVLNLSRIFDFKTLTLTASLFLFPCLCVSLLFESLVNIKIERSFHCIYTY